MRHLLCKEKKKRGGRRPTRPPRPECGGAGGTLARGYSTERFNSISCSSTLRVPISQTESIFYFFFHLYNTFNMNVYIVLCVLINDRKTAERTPVDQKTVCGTRFLFFSLS